MAKGIIGGSHREVLFTSAGRVGSSVIAASRPGQSPPPGSDMRTRPVDLPLRDLGVAAARMLTEVTGERFSSPRGLLDG
jgi:hypothetical protein